MAKGTPIELPTSANMHFIGVKLKGVKVADVDEADGTVTLMVPVAELTKAEHAMVQKLFPNVYERAFDLLNKEAVLAAMV